MCITHPLCCFLPSQATKALWQECSLAAPSLPSRYPLPWFWQPPSPFAPPDAACTSVPFLMASCLGFTPPGPMCTHSVSAGPHWVGRLLWRARFHDRCSHFPFSLSLPLSDCHSQHTAPTLCPAARVRSGWSVWLLQFFFFFFFFFFFVVLWSQANGLRSPRTESAARCTAAPPALLWYPSLCREIQPVPPTPPPISSPCSGAQHYYI